MEEKAGAGLQAGGRGDAPNLAGMATHGRRGKVAGLGGGVTSMAGGAWVGIGGGLVSVALSLVSSRRLPPHPTEPSSKWEVTERKAMSRQSA